MKKKKNRKIAFDCRFFLGDRPCKWHKQKGVQCECEYFSPIKGNILIVKLDAMGDVLRTTCLLPCIAEKWPGMNVAWITRQESVPLLENNPYVHDIIPYGPDALVTLAARSFDYAICLDAGEVSAGMAAMANAKKKIGYILDKEGHVSATNEAAENWLRMGIFDDLKSANQRSYQEIMCSILDVPDDNLSYTLTLTDLEIKRGRDHLVDSGLNLERKIIGIHTGGGGRWTLKQWNEDKFSELILELSRELGNEIQILLFGGPLERELNSRLIGRMSGSVLDAGCDNEVRHFASLIRNCSVVLSGDSLAMHVAIAMGRRVVVLFGPTSNTEIELFGLGEKVIPDLDCLACYKKVCDFKTNCMDLISVDMVRKAIFRQLAMA